MLCCHMKSAQTQGQAQARAEGGWLGRPDCVGAPRAIAASTGARSGLGCGFIQHQTSGSSALRPPF